MFLTMNFCMIIGGCAVEYLFKKYQCNCISFMFCAEEYQLDMMRRLRKVNVDHYHVGWYQSSDVGSFLSLPLLESQFHYQTSIEESVVLIYGNVCFLLNLVSNYYVEVI